MAIRHTPVGKPTAPQAGIRWVAWGMVTWCVGFAAVNVVLEASGRLDHGPLAGYSTGLAVMEWLVVGLKVLGAAAAALTVLDRPRWVSTDARMLLVWGAFALLTLYSVVNLVELVHLLVSAPQQLTARSLAYVAFFAAGASGYGLLALSYIHRSGKTYRWAAVGALGAPAVLALLLGVAPAALSAAGLLPG